MHAHFERERGDAAGCGQAKLLANWGNGFATDPAVLSHVTPRASDASSFFIATWNKPYVDQIVLAPHFYCPAVRTALYGVPRHCSHAGGKAGGCCRCET